ARAAVGVGRDFKSESGLIVTDPAAAFDVKVVTELRQAGAGVFPRDCARLRKIGGSTRYKRAAEVRMKRRRSGVRMNCKRSFASDRAYGNCLKNELRRSGDAFPRHATISCRGVCTWAIGVEVWL